ncbi:putative cell wall-binding protein [Caldicoprobacter guelmensis]|uniref:cell wall-binding repeat-containing protein n=1 Tax=Caldicoprobacter guelmensis TaxID=1170224 RepID=UPI00195734BB|nr:cell wall-binding repeat-containing protein [Caldicoprobacter guelmensis]MBM7581723.1 putative cell wall-binding protein [Caldicoprobacter guelmensis]
MKLKKSIYVYYVVLAVLLIFPVLLSATVKPPEIIIDTDDSPKNLIRVKDLNKDGLVNLYDYVLHFKRITVLYPGKTIQQNVGIRINLPSDVRTWEEFAVEIKVSGVRDLYGMSLEMTYNPNILRVVGVTQGDVFNSTGSLLKEVVNYCDNDAGSLSYACVLTGGRGITGDGTLLYIRFRAVSEGYFNMMPVFDPAAELKEGTWNLRLMLADSTALPIKYEISDASMEARIYPMPEAISSIRIAGKNRYDTAIEASKRGWASAESVILTGGEDYVDALAAAPLSRALDAPLLLTPSHTLYPGVLDELERLGASYVYILGGREAVSKNIEKDLASLGYHVERIYGSDRVNTSIEVASRLKEITDFDTVVLATGYDYPDALAAAACAAQRGQPILLTAGSSLEFELKDAIERWGIKKVIIAGGPAAVSPNIEKQLEKIGLTSERIYGTDRYLTSVRINRYYDENHSGSSGVVLATGQDYPDMLAGVCLAAKKGWPFLLVPRYYVKAETLNYLRQIAPQIREVYVIGGTGAIDDSNWFSIIDAINEVRVRKQMGD